MMQGRTVHEVLTAPTHTTQILYVQKHASRTLYDLKRCTAALIGVLKAKPYQSYALCLDDTFNFTCALLACIYAKKTPVLPGHKVLNLLRAELSEQQRFDCLMTEEEFPEFEGVPACNISTLRECTLTEAELEALFASAPAPDSPIILYTSGSTGESKRILKPLYCMEREAVLLYEHFKSRLDAELRVAGTVYPWHMYGLTFRIFFPLLSGVAQECGLIHFSEELCARAEELMLITSPAFVSRLDYTLKAPNIRLTTSAGGKLNSESAARYAVWSGCAFDEIYGSTETGVMATRLYRGADLVWQPFPGVSFEPQDDYVYLHSPLIPEESFRLDDLLSFDEQGHFTILGRRDRTVKIEEQRVSLTELEARFCSLPDILECAVVVLTEAEKTYLGAVLRVSDSTLDRINRDGLVAFKKGLRKALLNSVEGTVIPKKMRIVTRMPSNHMGKRPVAKLKELFNHADAR
ncbi:MAG: AMP-binding protein [Succinivibrio sp.]|nr:AMP-binding protein [Succinivibrio sp.]